MKTLFVHQNFPGQFKHWAPALAQQPGNQVVALHINASPALPCVQAVRYAVDGKSRSDTHPWLADLEAKVLRGASAYRAACALRAQGFTPDVIVAHPGWGESLYLKQVWPQARLGLYCEFFYHLHGADTHFDPEFSAVAPDLGCRLQMKNANYVLHFPQAALGIAPTHWQKSVFPPNFRSQISVIHDGIDTRLVAPNPAALLHLRTPGADIEISRNDEIITFVNRNLEPYRGYHTFMRALPSLLRQRPRARVVIVGGDGVSYGAAPPAKEEHGRQVPQTWRQIFLDEVKGELDLSRVHWVGRVPYSDFIRLLQLSTVHVCLTYPFVLSWSLLEAMSIGCAIVASDTEPVREAIADGATGRLVDFFSPQTLADRVAELCADAPQRARLGAAARAFAIEHYDLQQRCLPAQMQWMEQLAQCSP